MSEITNESWSTTFFYGQDLRSLYFNGLLSSVLRPGVQNGNICIYYNTFTNSFDLYLKKGTTLLFSNKYKKDLDATALTGTTNSANIIRDLSEPGTFLIKCTALQDITSNLLILDDTNRNGQFLKKFFEAEEIYVYATMVFNGEGDLKDGNIPRFRWAIRSSFLEESSSKYEKGLFFRTSGTSSVTLEYKILDGKWVNNDGTLATVNFLNANYYERTLYVLLGRVIRNKTYTPDTSINFDSASTAEFRAAAARWIQAHPFTSRGLPDYRTDFTSVSTGLAPALIPRSSDRFNYQIDLKNILLKNKVRTLAETNWMKSLGVFEEIQSPNDETVTAARVLKDSSENKIKAAENESSKYKDTVLHGNLDLTDKQAKIVFDFFYLLHRDEEDRQTPRSLSELLEANKADSITNIKAKTFTWVVDGKLATASLGEEASVLVRDESNYRYTTNPYVALGFLTSVAPRRPGMDDKEAINAFSSYNNRLSIGKVFWNYADSGTGGTDVIQFLDMSPLNLERFEYLLADTDFMPNLINLLRHEYPEYLCLSDNSTDNVATTLIPVGLAIRPFIKKQDSQSGEDIWYLADSLTGTIDELKRKSTGYLDEEDPETCPPSPANVFSFFDLKNKGASVKEYNLESTDLYTLIPIIN